MNASAENHLLSKPNQKATPSNGAANLLSHFIKKDTPQKGSQVANSQRSELSAAKQTGSAFKQGSLLNFVKK